MAKEYQPATSAMETAVKPDAVSSIVLSGGRTIPFIYYLGANSTCPLVKLESPTSAKELTWGDTVELPPGATVSVRNISYMPGDIQIQSGPVPAPPPRRITVPVEFTSKITGGGAVTRVVEFTANFPCDTRRARRAYLAWGTNDVVSPRAQIVVRGFNQQHSGSQQAGLPVYIDQYDLVGAIPELIPLGTSLDGNGMRLGDFARFDAVLTAPGAGSDEQGDLRVFEVFYVVEY